MIEHYGGEVIGLGVTPDEPGVIKDRLYAAVSQKVDLILTSAGVSVGEFDYVRSVVRENGALTFWRVNMRPGKPLAFGSYQGIPLIVLPGNPVSAYVGFPVIVLPILRKMAGLTGIFPTYKKVILSKAVESDGRESYLRTILHSAASSRNQIIKKGGLSLWHNSGLKSGNEARNHLSLCHDRP